MGNMNKLFLEYYLNAVHYCLWLFRIKFSENLRKFFLSIILIIPWLILSKKYWEQYYNKIKRNIKIEDKYLKDKRSGSYIFETYCWFSFIYDCYFFVFSFIIIGVYIKNGGNFDNIIPIALFLVPMVLGYIPAYRSVFYMNKYLKYFKEFEKEDKEWHRKWKRRTIAFCFGGIGMFFLGLILFLVILGVRVSNLGYPK